MAVLARNVDSDIFAVKTMWRLAEQTETLCGGFQDRATVNFSRAEEAWHTLWSERSNALDIYIARHSMLLKLLLFTNPNAKSHASDQS